MPLAVERNHIFKVPSSQRVAFQLPIQSPPCALLRGHWLPLDQLLVIFTGDLVQPCHALRALFQLSIHSHSVAITLYFYCPHCNFQLTCASSLHRHSNRLQYTIAITSPFQSSTFELLTVSITRPQSRPNASRHREGILTGRNKPFRPLHLVIKRRISTALEPMVIAIPALERSLRSYGIPCRRDFVHSHCPLQSAVTATFNQVPLSTYSSIFNYGDVYPLA